MPRDDWPRDDSRQRIGRIRQQRQLNLALWNLE